MEAHPGGEQRRPPEVTNHASRTVALHDRQPPDTALQHLRDRLMQRFVGKRDRQLRGAGLRLRSSRPLGPAATRERYLPSDDADQSVLLVHKSKFPGDG
jgi:hypothetical protein